MGSQHRFLCNIGFYDYGSVCWSVVSCSLQTKEKGFCITSLFFFFVFFFFTDNMKLNDLRMIICLKKCKVSVKRIPVCNVMEKMAKYGIHFVP